MPQLDYCQILGLFDWQSDHTSEALPTHSHRASMHVCYREAAQGT